MRDLTFENSSLMSLATKFSLWSMQCVILYMALAPSVHIATHFGQAISCSRKKIVDHFENLWTFFYLQAAAYTIEIPPASHFGRQITKKLKAERRLTHRWIHLIVVQIESAFGSFATSCALTSAGNSSIEREKKQRDAFSFFYVLILPKHRFSHITSCWRY